MREIKFRAWSSTLAKMFKVRSIDADGCPIMQYTGLHDKNGKDAYHNDIVDAEIAHFGKHKCLIEWSDVTASFYFKVINPFMAQSEFSPIHIVEFEVIGNIYENLELISEVK